MSNKDKSKVLYTADECKSSKTRDDFYNDFKKIKNSDINSDKKNKKKFYRFLKIGNRNQDDYNRLVKHITEQKLFFTSPKDYNDPFDCILFKKNEIWFDPDNLFELSKLVDDNAIRSKCFNTFDYFNTSEDDELTFKDHINNRDLMNFILMFAHYGESHKGVLIEYEYNPEKLTHEDVKLLEVNYTDNLKVVESKDLLKSGLEKKLKMWEYEHEYRFVFWNKKFKDAKNEEFNISLKDLGLIMTKIIFGVANQDESKKENKFEARDRFFNDLYENKRVSLSPNKLCQYDNSNSLAVNQQPIQIYQTRIDGGNQIFLAFDKLSFIEKNELILKVSGDDEQINPKKVTEEIYRGDTFR